MRKGEIQFVIELNTINYTFLWPWASAEIFPGGKPGNVHISLIRVRLLTMQCKSTLRKRLTFSTRLHHKQNDPCYDNSHKNALVWQP